MNSVPKREENADNGSAFMSLIEQYFYDKNQKAASHDATCVAKM